MNNITFDINLAADTDAYKQHHYDLINPALEYLYSYGEARVGGLYPEVCYFGLTPVVLQYFMAVPSKEQIQEARELYIDTNGYDGFDQTTWDKVLQLGYLPIKISGAPEGSIVPVNNVLFTLESTEKWFAKTTNSLETLLMHVWYPISIATRAMTIKKSIIPYFKKTGSMDSLPFAVNDFGARGATGSQQAIMGGMAALLYSSGSDNLLASRWVKRIYGDTVGPAKSIRATEHSVALSYGRGQGEIDYFTRILDRTPSSHMFACVIDTYDAHGFIRNVAGNSDISKRVIQRDGRVVFRPDSGEPKVIVPQILELLGEIYGYTYNRDGYKVLSHNVGVIQGDGMDEKSIPELYKVITNQGWSAENLATGSGGGLLQKDINRDTNRFAIKPSFGIIGGEPFNFKKHPTTDLTKSSKPGLLKLHPQGDSFITISSANESKAMFNSYHDSMITYLHNGDFLPSDNFETIRERANAKL